MKKALITGINGQDGSYLAEFLLEKGYEVHGIVRRASTFNRWRIEHLHQHVFNRNSNIYLQYGDLTDAASLIRILKEVQPDEIYNLAAQSHVQVSFETPEYTASVDGLGTLRMIEAMRMLGLTKTKFYQASTSEMYGNTPSVPQNEDTPFLPRNPYGVAKIYGYWIVRTYREAYDMFLANGVLFNHECITGQTPVIIKNHDLIDILAIEEIVPHRENPRHGIKYSTVVNNNLEVWDGDRWTKVKTLTATWNKVNSRADKRVKRVISRGGYYEATNDHISFLKGRKEEKTGNLRRGDLLELKSYPALTQKTLMTLEEAEFLGMMVADGYVSSEGKGRFINNNKILRNRVQELWQKIASGTSREDKHPSGFNKGKFVGSVELSGNRNYLRLVWGEIYNQKLFKKIPKLILNGDPETIKSFLKGYNCCDGLKRGRQKTQFKSFTTNSAVLAAGLWYLTNQALNLRITLHPEFRKDKLYFHLNVNSDNKTLKGKHLQREISEIKSVKDYDYSGWLFDLETESGTFSAGVGLTWVHNSPRRGENFVSKKITQSLARIKLGMQDKLVLGNLDAKRDWGYAKEYIEAMWLMLQQDKPQDFVIATGEAHTVREFVEEAAKVLAIDIKWQGTGRKEKGIDAKTGQVIVELDERFVRPTEINILQGDAARAKRVLGWEPKVKFKELVRIMATFDLERYKLGSDKIFIDA